MNNLYDSVNAMKIGKPIVSHTSLTKQFEQAEAATGGVP